MFSITSCYKENIEPLPKPVDDIFKETEISVLNDQDISFNLEQGGTFILKLVDIQTQQVISKEMIELINGKNTIKIFTKSIQSTYLYLVLEDLNKNELKKTKVIINN